MRITTEKESPVVLTPASPKISTAPDIITRHCYGENVGPEPHKPVVKSLAASVKL